MAKVSVIVPVFNAKKYISETIDSIINQTLKDIEIICVDDGSTDGSYNILCELAKLDKRIKVFQHIEKTEGAAEARNLGLDAAIGEYVSFLDADDFFEKEMLEKAYIKAKKMNAQIVMFDGWAYDNKVGIDYKVPWILNHSNIPEKEVFSAHDNPGRLYLMNSGAAWNNLYNRRWLIEKGIRFYSLNPDDQVFVHMAYSLADSITIQDERLIHYRKNNESSQVSRATEHPEVGYMASLALYKELSNRGILEEHRASLVNLALINAIVYLDFMKTQESFDSLYYKLQNEVLYDLEIEKVKEEEYISTELVKRKEWILSCTPEQYLINQRIRSDSGFEFDYIYSRFRKDYKIAIYGAGEYGRRLFKEILGIEKFRVVGWADRKADVMGYPIMSPDELLLIHFDIVVVAVMDRLAFSRIKQWLLENNINRKKIIWIGDKEGN